MHPLSIEETWMTTRWPNRVFCFLLALTMVNVQNAATYFAKTPKMDCLSARHLIAKQLINNKYLHSQLTQKMEKTRFSPAQPRHGPYLQRNYSGATGQL